jgi:ribosomal protein S26
VSQGRGSKDKGRPETQDRQHRATTLSWEDLDSVPDDYRLRCDRHPRAGLKANHRGNYSAVHCALCGALVATEEQLTAWRITKAQVDEALTLGSTVRARAFAEYLAHRVENVVREALVQVDDEPSSWSYPLIAKALLHVSADYANRCGIERAVYEAVVDRMLTK